MSAVGTITFMQRVRATAPNSIIAKMKTQGEAAAYLGVTPQTMSVYRREGRGPQGYRHEAGVVLYPIAELDKWKARKK